MKKKVLKPLFCCVNCWRNPEFQTFTFARATDVNARMMLMSVLFLLFEWKHFIQSRDLNLNAMHSSFLLYTYPVCFRLETFAWKLSYCELLCLLTFWFKYFRITIFFTLVCSFQRWKTLSTVLCIWLCVGFFRWISNEVSLVFFSLFLVHFFFWWLQNGKNTISVD